MAGVRDRVRVGVVGVGHLGGHHARLLAASPAAHLVAVHDLDGARAHEVAGQSGTRAAATLGELLDAVDAVTIAVPTSCHREVAEAAIAAGRAVLVEKPLAAATGDAAAIVEAARRAGVPLMVGHVERWNGAFRALAPRLGRARFVEAHRLASFPGRGLDVDVILDLMIHDLDLVASLAAAPPVRVEAVGVSVLTDTADIANARLEFADGMVANLTASRVSREAVRKMRIFQDDAYLTCDFLRKTAEIYSKRPGAEAMLGVDRRSDGETGGGTAGRSPVPASVVMAAIEHERFGPVETPEPLGAELEAFVEAVATGRPPVPDGAAGLEAVRLAERVTTSMAAAAARMGVATAADGAALPGTPPA